jgi:hypothetical protein
MGEKRNAYRILVGARRKETNGNTKAWWAILKWVLRDRMEWYALD